MTLRNQMEKNPGECGWELWLKWVDVVVGIAFACPLLPPSLQISFLCTAVYWLHGGFMMRYDGIMRCCFILFLRAFYLFSLFRLWLYAFSILYAEREELASQKTLDTPRVVVAESIGPVLSDRAFRFFLLFVIYFYFYFVLDLSSFSSSFCFVHVVVDGVDCIVA